MKIKDMIMKAVDTEDGALARQVADHYRYNFHASYEDILALFQDYRPDLERADFDALMEDERE